MSTPYSLLEASAQARQESWLWQSGWSPERTAGARFVSITQPIHNNTPVPERAQRELSVGIILTYLASVLVGLSFVLRREGLLQALRDTERKRGGGEEMTGKRGGWREGGCGGRGAQSKGASGAEAGAGPSSSASSAAASHLDKPLWWAGVAAMIVGEACNFGAYAFAPSVFVAPLASFSLVVAAVVGHVCSSAKLHLLGKAGCALLVLGAVIITLHAPPTVIEQGSVGAIWLVRFWRCNGCARGVCVRVR